MRQRRYCAQDLGGHPQNCSATLLVSIGSTQTPGLLGSEVFIGGGDDRPDEFECAREFESVVVFEDFADGGLGDFGKLLVLRLKFSSLRNFSAKTAINHRGGAARKITQAVGKIAVVASDQSLATEAAVSTKNNFAQQEVAQSVYTQDADDGLRGLNVAARLGHFLVLKQEMAVSENLFW